MSDLRFRYIPLKSGLKEPLHAGWRDQWTCDRPTGNAGIVLTGRLVVIDIDEDCQEATQLGALLKPFACWQQQTRRGMHYLFEVDPFSPKKNEKLLKADGMPFGDLKTNGFIVAPDSVVDGFHYKLLHDKEPLPFAAVASFVEPFRKKAAETQKNGAGESMNLVGGGVPRGEHDQWLSRLAGWLRGQGGLGEERIYSVLHKGALEALQDVDSSKPYTPDDLKRLARSGASYAIERANGTKDTRRIRTAADIERGNTMTHWLLDDFIPKGEFILQYGRGGIGKSTWISWLAGDCVRHRERFAVSSTEEPFERFSNRVHASHPLSAEERTYLYDLDSTWTFPNDASELRETIERLQLQVVYFDSIYAHFSPETAGLNAAERARTCLTSLMEIARELRITIIGTFHENKNGDFLGSREMENVPRVVLHATKEGSDNLLLSVSKTNFLTPSFSYRIQGTCVPYTDIFDESLQETMRDGTVRQKEIFIVEGLITEPHIQEIEIIPEDVHLRQAPKGAGVSVRLTGERDYQMEIAEYRADHPFALKKDVSKALCIDTRTTAKYWT